MTTTTPAVTGAPGDLATAQRWLAAGVYGAMPGMVSDLHTYYDGVVELCTRMCGVTLPRPDRVVDPVQAVLVRARIDALLRLLLRAPAEAPAEARAVAGELAAVPLADAPVSGADDPVLLDTWTSAAARHVADVIRAAEADPGQPVLRPATPVERDNLARAMDLLHSVVPDIASHTLPMVRVVTLAEDVAIGGAYYGDTPWAVHLNATHFRSATHLAASVLHESLHEKFATLRTTRQLFAAGYTDENSPPVVLPWTLDGSRGAREFNVGRAVATTHVYVHLAVFYAGLAEAEPSRAGGHLAESRRAFQRADLLVRALCNPRQRDVLAGEGRQLLDWLTQGLDLLSLAVPSDFVPIMYR
ncbi:hypothetical protein [Longispora urticae]